MLEDIKKTLWATADKLRANMDAAEYKQRADATAGWQMAVRGAYRGQQPCHIQRTPQVCQEECLDMVVRGVLEELSDVHRDDSAAGVNVRTRIGHV